MKSKMDKEADDFAMALLLPENLVRREMRLMHLDFVDSNDLSIMAKKFKVTEQMMAIRIGQLYPEPREPDLSSLEEIK